MSDLTAEYWVKERPALHRRQITSIRDLLTEAGDPPVKIIFHHQLSPELRLTKNQVSLSVDTMSLVQQQIWDSEHKCWLTFAMLGIAPGDDDLWSRNGWCELAI